MVFNTHACIQHRTHIKTYIRLLCVCSMVYVHVCWFHEWPEVELPSWITPTVFREAESLSDPVFADSASLCR